MTALYYALAYLGASVVAALLAGAFIAAGMGEDEEAE